MDAPHDFEGPVVVVLSGGNIDPLLLMRVIRHGMAAQGRYLAIRCRISDKPGGLARLLVELSEADANVLDVVHERTAESLPLDQVEVVLQMEMRGAAAQRGGARQAARPRVRRHGLLTATPRDVGRARRSFVPCRGFVCALSRVLLWPLGGAFVVSREVSGRR